MYIRRTVAMVNNKAKTPDSTQKSISTFFQKSTKRFSSSENTTPAKVQKIDENKNKENSSPLSPEQKKRMEEKRLEAQAKLTDRATHGLCIGETWRKALSAEFTKDYFVKVCIICSFSSRILS